MTITAQDIFDIMADQLDNYPRYGQGSWTADGVKTVYGLLTPIVPSSDVVKVATVTKTRGTQYTIDDTTGEITFTTGNVPTNGQAITCDCSTLRFSHAAMLRGIKNALSPYYYETIDKTLSATSGADSVGVSTLGALRITFVEFNVGTATEPVWKPARWWKPDTAHNPRTLFFKYKFASAIPLRIKHTVAFSTSGLTTASSTLSTAFPTEPAAIEVLALSAAYSCASGARYKRIADSGFPEVADDMAVKPPDYRTLANDIYAIFEKKEQNIIHLLKPPVTRQPRIG
ncbi:MAG TPA: hypothetical protein VGK02_06290 [Candidatus Aquicultor sp.]|jgi:hypothetical protein